MQLIVLLSLVIALPVILASTVKDGKRQLTPKTLKKSSDWSKIVPRTEVSLDTAKLKKVIKDAPHSNPFVHHKELIKTVNEEKKKFFVTEDVDTTVNLNSDSTYEDILSSQKYHLTATYDLHSDASYHSFDQSNVFMKVQELNVNSIHVCDMNVAPGHFFIGTDDGAWFEKKHAGTNYHKYGLNSMNGMVLSRKVLSVTPSEKPGCHIVQTEIIAPFELFHHFKIESYGDLPYTHYSSPSKLAPTDGSANSPVYSCSDTSIFYDTAEVVYSKHTADDDYTIVGAVDFGCASMNNNFGKDLNSFCFNYDPSTQSASSAITIFGGLECENCFTYIGVSAYVVAEYYDDAKSFAFEGKLSGGAGFNVEIAATNPTISGSDTFILLGPYSSPSHSIYLGYGLSLVASFGGLNATVSGSAQFQGSFDAGAGAQCNAYLGVSYYDISPSQYGFDFPNNAQFESTPPYFNLDLTSGTIDFNVELVAVENFAFGFIYQKTQWVAIDFDIEVSAVADYSFTINLSADDIEAPQTSLQVSDAVVAQPDSSVNGLSVYHPGDEVSVTVNFNNYPAGEEVYLFYTYHRDNSPFTGVGIATTKFTVPAGGRGSVVIRWTIPWDTRIYQRSDEDSLVASALSVHSSLRMSEKIFSSGKFVVVGDIHTDSSFTTSHAGQKYSVNDEVLLTFQSSPFSYYDTIPGNSGFGTFKIAGDLEVVLVQMIVDEKTGKITRSQEVQLMDVSEYAMSVGLITVPVSLAAAVSLLETSSEQTTYTYQFYLQSKSIRNFQAWSAGFFSLTLVSQPVSTNLRVPSPAGAKDTLVSLPSHRILLQEDTIETARRYLQVSCDSSCDSQLTVSASLSGDVTQAEIGTEPIKIGMTTGNVVIFEPYCICLDGDAVEGPAVAYEANTRPRLTAKRNPQTENMFTPNTVYTNNANVDTNASGSSSTNKAYLSTGAWVGISVSIATVVVAVLVFFVWRGLQVVGEKKAMAVDIASKGDTSTTMNPVIQATTAMESHAATA